MNHPTWRVALQAYILSLTTSQRYTRSVGVLTLGAVVSYAFFIRPQIHINRLLRHQLSERKIAITRAAHIRAGLSDAQAVHASYLHQLQQLAQHKPVSLEHVLQTMREAGLVVMRVATHGEHRQGHFTTALFEIAIAGMYPAYMQLFDRLAGMAGITIQEISLEKGNQLEGRIIIGLIAVDRHFFDNQIMHFGYPGSSLKTSVVQDP